jgi:3-isopropylmalate/(R)-2-methylmalate dehydratase large subunit
MTDRVIVFDTTLRDGEQAPGCSLTAREKLEVARQLALLGVDVIEAGFPASSQGDWDAVNAVASEVGTRAGPVICGLARANERDIERCASAVKPAARRRIHTFIATSDLHIERKLRKTRRDVLAIVPAMVAYARTFCDDVEFSPEDATRSDRGFLLEVLAAALEAGATTLNIPDTVGYAMPEEYHDLIAAVIRQIRPIRDIRISAHCHDDLGMAVANSLAAVRAGARQVECTVNGLGERAGNAALEEIVMALATRHELFGTETGVRTTELSRTSRLVAERTGVAVPPNKAIVGANAFAHEAGIHQDGVLKHRSTYEIMRAESVGLAGNRIVLGKHSGRNAVRRSLEQIAGGRRLDDAVFSAAFARFKEIADDKKTVDDHDLEQLVAVRDEPRARTIFEKVWDAHVVRAETPDAPALLYVDLQLIHEVTSPQAFAELAERGLRVRRPDLTVATMDHSTPTTPAPGNGRLHIRDMMAAAQLRQLEVNCAAHGIPLHALGSEGQGIVHVIGPELGLTQPGMTIVCGDSHTSTHGAFGALAFGIGTSEVAHVLATQCLLQRRPRTMEVRIEGRLRAGITAKDIILAVITRIGVAGGTGYVIEYTGSAIRALDMESRMTICNMSIEAGARAGLISPDDTTIAYLRGRPHVPHPAGREWDAAVERWSELRTDDGATYDRAVTMDAGDIEPMISYGTNPGMCIPIHGRIPDPRARSDAHERSALEKALRYMALEPGEPILGKKVDVVFLGSCTNSRLSDLRAAATLLEGRRVASGVRMLVVPGSQAVRSAAEREGLHDVFLGAGAEWREPGCSMCIGMNEDRLLPGQYAVSTSNRNFEGRQGAGGRTFLASPLTAAAAAVTGRITDARTLL